MHAPQSGTLAAEHWARRGRHGPEPIGQMQARCPVRCRQGAGTSLGKVCAAGACRRPTLRRFSIMSTASPLHPKLPNTEQGTCRAQWVGRRIGVDVRVGVGVGVGSGVGWSNICVCVCLGGDGGGAARQSPQAHASLCSGHGALRHPVRPPGLQAPRPAAAPRTCLALEFRMMVPSAVCTWVGMWPPSVGDPSTKPEQRSSRRSSSSSPADSRFRVSTPTAWEAGGQCGVGWLTQTACPLAVTSRPQPIKLCGRPKSGCRGKGVSVAGGPYCSRGPKGLRAPHPPPW